MYKLNQDDILSLEPTEEVFHVKLTRIFWPTPVVEWEGRSQLHIQRSTPKKGIPSMLSIITPKAYNWAEGSFFDVDADGDIVVEDYAMEVFRITEGNLHG